MCLPRFSGSSMANMRGPKMDRKKLAKKLLQTLAYRCAGEERGFCPLAKLDWYDGCPFDGIACHDVTLDDWRNFFQDFFSAPAVNGDPVHAPAHYTQYPVEVIQITRPLGFCLGNATKYALRAPFKGGVEDCEKAKVYLRWQNQDGLRPISCLDAGWMRCVYILQAYFDGFDDRINRALYYFMYSLRRYVVRPSSVSCNEMMVAVDKLQKALEAKC